MKVIAVSGSPGTGKTTIAKELSKKKGMKYIDVKRLITQQGISESFDKKRDCLIVDVKKLNRALIKIISQYKKEKDIRGIVLDSHLSHYLPKKYVDICIITKCGLPELKRRLEKRGYRQSKIRENLDAEIFDVCRIEALEAGHKVKTVYTDVKKQNSRARSPHSSRRS
jgi:adenylate kinase